MRAAPTLDLPEARSDLLGARPRRRPTLLALLATLGGCASVGAPPPRAAPAPQAVASPLRAIPLPGGDGGPILMDYLAYEPGQRRLWVPAGNTGTVDVIDPVSGRVDPIGGFPTAEVERNGHRRNLGPSSAAVGEGVVYVGNRGDRTVCAVDAATRQKGPCLTLDTSPDGLAYLASRHELWVTTPRAKAIVVLDVASRAALKEKARIALEGEPEGYAADEARGAFYTNLEDLDRTVAIDLATRAVKQSWPAGCGGDGPKGLALDRARGWLFLACPDRAKVLDPGRGGLQLSAIDTGEGADNLDYLEARHALYIGAGRAARLTVARVDPEGHLSRLASLPTASGARNPVCAPDDTAFLTDSARGLILMVPPSPDW